MSDDAKKAENKKGRFLACVALYERDVQGPDGLTVKQLDRIFKSSDAAEYAIYEWLKSEYMGKRDVRFFLFDAEEGGDDEDSFELNKLVMWLNKEKGLYVEYTITEVDD